MQDLTKDYSVTDIDELVSEFTAVQKEFQTKAQKAMKKAFKEFFDSNPRVTSICWTQYTPYFNDGDECVFRLHEMFASIGETPKDEKHEYIEDRSNVFTPGGKWKDDEFNKEYEQEIKNFAAFSKLMYKLPNDIFEQSFGNHIEVTATREGFSIEEYDHE